jgi:deoxycytidine triphosphate deaminase
MILSAERIKKQVTEEKLIEGFSEKSLSHAGYDLRVGRFYKIRGEAHLGVEQRVMPEVDEIITDEITLKPGEYLLIETLEKVHMPKDLMARILPRSTLFRAGCALITAVVDPGYYGTLTMGLKNMSSASFQLEKGSRVGQIVFEELAGEATSYNGRYQGGKVV